MCSRFAACGALLLAAALFSACGGPSPSGPTAESSAHPAPPPPAGGPVNVVWILLDACRPDHLSCYGYHRPTSPHIDALAKRGVRFDRNFAQGPATLLSVESYMTGRYMPAQYQDARHLGLWFLHTPEPGEKLVSTIFKENGYATAMFSASPWYGETSRLGRSFDTFTPLAYDIDSLGRLNYRESAVPPTFESLNPDLFKWIADHAASPFFVYLHSLDTHQPHLPPDTDAAWFDPSFPEARDKDLRWWRGAPFSEADRRRIVDLYDSDVMAADETVHAVVAALERAGVLDRTLILIGSDHGDALAEDGETLGHPDTMSYDDLLRTPLILAGPGLPAGKTIQIRTENADIVPTLVDLLGLKTDARFDGVSLRPAISAPDPLELHEYTFARTSTYYFSTEPNRVIRFDDAKFELSPYPAEHFQQPGDGKAMYVWAVPDRIGNRREIPAPALRLARADELIRTLFDPAWDAHEAQPIETPPYFEVAGDQVLVDPAKPNPVTDAEDPKDNLWTRRTSPYLWRFEEQTLLISHPYSEDAPGLVLTQKVPNGTYHISIFCRTLDTGGDDVRGASFSFLQIPTERDFRVFGVPAAKPDETNKEWIEVGTYTITDGTFVYWLDEGRREDVTVVGGLRFVPLGSEAAVPGASEVNEERERLKSLGYTGK